MKRVLKFLSLFTSTWPKGFRVRGIYETFDQRWAARYRFNFETSVNEAILRTLKPDEMGGVIVFSTVVNSTVNHANPIVQWFKRQFHSWKNKFTHKRKLDKAIKDRPDVGGYSIGNFFKGRYKDETTGELFDERSLSVDVVLINHTQLIDLATTLCGLFNQQSVIVKDNYGGAIHLVDRKPLR